MTFVIGNDILNKVLHFYTKPWNFIHFWELRVTLGACIIQSLLFIQNHGTYQLSLHFTTFYAFKYGKGHWILNIFQ